MFLVDGQINYIHHNGNDPNEDEPAIHVSLAPGEKVRWVSRDGDFSIDFGAISPFDPDEPNLSGTQGNETKYKKIKKPARSGPNPSFKYTAMVAGVKDDPDIIIDNSGGGGPTPKHKPKVKKAKKRK